MAITLTASNSDGIAGKWNPYYFKPFLLGRQGDGQGSTDGEIYITQTTGTSDLSLRGICNSSVNCGFYYLLTFDNASGSRYFYVEKYDLNDNKIDTIHASELGVGDNGKWWKVTANTTVTIDIGVSVYFINANLDDLDVYKITLPSADVMERRKIYHGGYSTFLRMPEIEGKAYHSDIIPTSLKNRNVTILFNPNIGMTTSGTVRGHYLSTSKEDLTGNQAVSLALEWNTNKDSATSSSAGSNTDANYTWGSGETWQLGSLFVDDINPSAGADSPLIQNFPSSDVLPEGDPPTTGLTQVLNTSVSGRAGYARIKTEYMTGAGTSPVAAFNQFWLIILIIS